MGQEKEALQDELKIVSLTLSEESAKAANASLSEEKIHKMMKQIESYQEKLADLNEQVGGHAARTAAAEASWPELRRVRCVCVCARVLGEAGADSSWARPT